MYSSSGRQGTFWYTMTLGTFQPLHRTNPLLTLRHDSTQAKHLNLKWSIYQNHAELVKSMASAESLPATQSVPAPKGGVISKEELALGTTVLQLQSEDRDPWETTEHPPFTAR